MLQKGPEIKYDKISKPSHYAKGRAFEPKDVIRDWDLNFNLGNAVKYVARAGRKEGTDILEDLQKAKRYLEYEIEAVEKERNSANSLEEATVLFTKEQLLKAIQKYEETHNRMEDDYK